MVVIGSNSTITIYILCDIDQPKIKTALKPITKQKAIPTKNKVMSKQKRILRSMIQLACLNPNDFFIEHQFRGMTRIVHKQTGKKIELHPHEDVYINGAILRRWVKANAIPDCSLDESLRLLNRFMEEGATVYQV